MKARTIRTSMFLTYAIILITACVIYYSLFVVFEVQNVGKQTLATISQYSVTIGDAIDSQLEDLNMVTMNVAYSNIVKSTFSEYNNSYNSGQSDNFNNTKMLGDLLVAIIGPNFAADQINLYALDNGIFASGVSNGYYANITRDMPWYQEVMDASGYKVIKYTGEDPKLSRYYNGEYKKSFVSLFRVYFNVFNNPQGIVEAKKSANAVFASAITHKSIYGEKSMYLIPQEPWFTQYPIMIIASIISRQKRLLQAAILRRQSKKKSDPKFLPVVILNFPDSARLLLFLRQVYIRMPGIILEIRQ